MTKDTEDGYPNIANALAPILKQHMCARCGGKGYITLPGAGKGAGQVIGMDGNVDCRACAVRKTPTDRTSALAIRVHALELVLDRVGHAITCNLNDDRSTNRPVTERTCTCGVWEAVPIVERLVQWVQDMHAAGQAMYLLVDEDKCPEAALACSAWREVMKP